MSRERAEGARDSGKRQSIARGDVWIADVLAVWRDLGVVTDDDRELVARTLGFGYVALQAARTPPPSPGPVVVPSGGQRPEAGVAVVPTTEPGQKRDDSATANPAASILLRLETRSAPPPGTAPSWALVDAPIPEDEARHVKYAPIGQPLFRRGWIRGIVSALCATPAGDGPVDVPRLIESVCSGRPLTTLPRLPVWTLRRGVQLMIEESDDLSCFANDVDDLVAAISDTVGRDRTTTVYAEDITELPAMAGTGAGAVWQWSPPETPIVVISAFGLTRRPRRAATLDAWRRFARTVHNHRHPLLGITPFGPARWPAALQRTLPLFHWNRTATATAARRIRQR